MSLPASHTLAGLARALQQAHLLDSEQASAIQRSAQADKQPFIEALIRSGAMSDSALARFCSRSFGYPLLDLASVDLQALAGGLGSDRDRQVTLDQVIPLCRRAGRLSLALADPTNAAAMEQAKFRTGLSIAPVIVAYLPLMDLLSRVSQTTEKALSELIGNDLDCAVVVVTCPEIFVPSGI